MATIRKVTWKKKSGGVGFAWKLTYTDAEGERRFKNYPTRAEANDARIDVENALARGGYIFDGNSPTLKEATQAWLDYVEQLVNAGKRAHVTWEKYEQHIRVHVSQRPIARKKLASLKTPDCQEFVDALELDLSHDMALRVRSTVRTALAFAQRKGWIIHNPMQATEITTLHRDDDEVVIPEAKEVAAILDAARIYVEADKGQALAMVMTGFFTGVRPAELLALERPALTLVGASPQIRVSQAIDKRARIGEPKRKTSHRSVPIGPTLTSTLKAWLATGLAGAKRGERVGQDGEKHAVQMVFPSEARGPISYYNFRSRIWRPLLEEAGVITERETEDGEITREAKYPPNVMRHFAASLWIEQGISPKRLQRRMGHASIQTTMNIYGHLFSNAERDQEEAAAAESAVLGLKKEGSA